MPFAWGRNRNDCVSYAFGAVEAQTRADRLGRLNWAGEASAAAQIKRLGGLEAAVDRLLAPIPPALACRGDVAGVFDARFGVSLMVVEGATLVGPGETGEKRLPRSAMIRAWSADG